MTLRPNLNAQSMRLTLLILVSAGLALLRSGPLYGTPVALGLTVISQLVLPGFLLARVLGKLHSGHPILRFAWMLVCGLSLTITLGAVARVFTVPVALYLLGLHLVMLALAWMPSGTPDPDRTVWRFKRRFLPLYVVLSGACLVGMVISYNSRYRFYGFEDQVIFASQAGWIANNPGENPLDLPYLRARRIGALSNRDSRFDTDGWTYNHAAWVWASGVSASQLIWYDLNPLFVWTVPLITFALAYELTRREQAATWAAASLTVVGLLTLDSIVHNPGYTAYGRMAVFQVNVLRQASITFMLPLCLLVSLTYIRTRQRRDWLAMVLSGVALAILHPIIVMLLALSIAGTAVFHQWLGRRRWLPVPLPILLALVIILALPFIQRQNRVGSGAADTIINPETVAQASDTIIRSSFIVLPDVPLIGSTFIRNPADVFYHPALLLAAVLGLVYVIRVRRSLAAQFILGTTLAYWLIAFTPGLTALFNRIVSSVGLFTSAFILPVALILGLALDALLRRLPRYPLLPVVAGLIGLVVVLLLEPLPITASPADQLRTYNQMQESRRLLPTHEKLANRLSALLPPDQTSVLVAVPDSTSVIIEDLPRTLVTGGRAAANRARDGDNRFFNLFGSNEPWLDSADLDFMHEFMVTHVVIRADETRTPQLALQPARFTWLESVDGLEIFAFDPDVPAEETDDLFAEMNALYAEIIQPRWGPDGFALVRPGDAAGWLPLVRQWETLLMDQPDNNRIRLGLAFAYLMAGDDAAALPLWERLHDQHPEVAFFYDALAYTQHILGQPEAGFATLFAGLSSDQPAVRALAADSLLTETFLYLLEPDQLNSVLEVSADSAWDYLVFFDQPDTIRQQAALLMMAHQWEAASRWLDAVPTMMVSPRDLTAQAVADLAQGQIEAALARLQPATDPDWRAAKVFFQPDRWQTNHAARMFHLLTGDVARRDGRLDDALAAYQQAVDAGAILPGHFFLAQALEQADQVDAAAQARAELEAAWDQDTPLPDFVPLINIAASGDPYIMQPILTQDERAHTLTLTATYGNFQPHVGYPFKFWRYELISPDASVVYLTQDVPALLLNDALMRQAVTLNLPDDVEPLTPALLLVRAGFNNSVLTAPLISPVTLNRPDSATIPDNVMPLDYRFGDHITLTGYSLSAADDEIDLTLYWQTDTTLPEAYQIFVHVLDANGEIIIQNDTAPVQGRYPTSQWRPAVLIADAHRIIVPDLPEDFSIRLGLYRLQDGTRLPITPVDDRVDSASIKLAGS